MAALRNEKKHAALNKENCQAKSRRNLEQNTSVAKSQENYITQVNEKIEGKLTKKLSKEFSRTENRILGALPQLDEFLLNRLLQGHSGSAPETSRKTLNINQGTNEDNSHVDLHPEARVSQSQTTQVFGPDDPYDKRNRQTLGIKNCIWSFKTIQKLLGNIQNRIKISCNVYQGYYVRKLHLTYE